MTVFGDEGVEALNRTSSARGDEVVVRVRVRGQRLDDSVQDGLRDVAHVGELEADRLEHAIGTNRLLRLDRDGRAGVVEVEVHGVRLVAGFVYCVDAVEARDATELVDGNAVLVGVDVVGLVVLRRVDHVVVDLTRIGQLEVDRLVLTVDDRGVVLEFDLGLGGVDAEGCVLRVGDVSCSVAGVVAYVVHSIGQAGQVNRVRCARSRDHRRSRLDQCTTVAVLADVGSDFGQVRLVGRLDDDRRFGRVERCGNRRHEDGRLRRVDHGGRCDNFLHDNRFGCLLGERCDGGVDHCFYGLRCRGDDRFDDGFSGHRGCFDHRLCDDCRYDRVCGNHGGCFDDRRVDWRRSDDIDRCFLCGRKSCGEGNKTQHHQGAE